MELSGKVIVFESEKEAELWYESIQTTLKSIKIDSLRSKMDSWVEMNERFKSEDKMEHIVVPYKEFRDTIVCEIGFKQFPFGTDDEKRRSRHLEKCDGFYNGKAVVVDYSK